MLGALSHVVADIYLPSFQAIIQEFNAQEGQVQMSMAYFMFAFALSQLFYGPWSDAFGRRYPLIVGLLICLLGSIICYYATSIEMLNVGRFFQGFGTGAANVLGRAIMRDCYSGNTLARNLSLLGSITIIVMVTAPLAGGYVQEFFDWRINFVILIFYTALLIGSILFFIPETNQHVSAHFLKGKVLAQSVKNILSNTDFLNYTAFLSLAYGGILIWLSAGPILLEQGLHLPPATVGWLIFIEGMFYALGAWINAYLVNRQGYVITVKHGLLIMTLAGALLILSYFLQTLNVYVLMLSVGIYTIGTSFVFTNAFSGALHAFEANAGLASSLCGFLQILAGALSSTLYSFLNNTDQLFMGVGFFISGLVGVILFMVMYSGHSKEN